MGTISANFSYREFEASTMADHNGIINAITSARVRDAIKALVLEVLQPLRTAWRQPLKVNSGYRCAALNRLVGGVDSSQHTKGEAADIAAAKPLELAQLAIALQLPFDQMIIYPTFVHFSHRLEGKQRGRVLYAKTWRGAKPW